MMSNSEARKRQVPAPAPSSLTEVERAELRDVAEQHFMVTDMRRSPLRCSCGRWRVEDPGAPWPGFRAHFAMHNRLAVERILAARLAEQREQIAAAIEDWVRTPPGVEPSPATEAYLNAARIVREWGAR